MAQKVKIILVDDLDGGSADETVRFGIDGSSYEIDLSHENATKLRDSLQGYVSAARKSSARGQQAPRARSASGSTGSRNSDSAKIRQWARDNGYNVNSRGRIQAEIQEAYRKANA
ncbi:histone-like nucleoid-structuring protein Lsr2 [Sinomonas susongensis]|uniref:histone-like nucleoid-structuring protein Lsr2 n=1 Tax=Sinomonas susongensis TaxID=1324851 RepID=UPI001109BDA7|nr:Lsr2 family protein [Sinomonas susongensis]